MKTYSYLFILMYLFFGCSQKQEYRYNGDFPPEDYFYDFDGAVENIKRSDTITIPYRNRIYYTIDTLGDLYLNGHLTSIADFDAAFEYIIENPDDLPHLPESVDSTYLFFKSLDNEDRLQIKRTKIIGNSPDHNSFLGFLSRKINKARNYKPLYERLDWLGNEFPTYNKYGDRFKWKYYRDEKDQYLLGLLTTQPKRVEDTIISKRNWFTFFINDNNKIHFTSGLGKKIINWEDYNTFIFNEFINMWMSSGRNPNLPESPKKAIISISISSKAQYQSFSRLYYDEIMPAYDGILNMVCLERWYKHFHELTEQEQLRLKEEIPLNVRFDAYND